MIYQNRIKLKMIACIKYHKTTMTWTLNIVDQEKGDD